MSDKSKELKIPPRLYYPLPEAASYLNCSVKDVIHLGATGVLSFSLYIPSWIESDKDKLYVMHNGLILDDVGQDEKRYLGMLGDGWSISGIYEYTPNDNDFINEKVKCAKYINGFFKIGASSLTELEFNADADTFSVSGFDVSEDYNGLGPVVLYSFLGVKFPVKNLCIMASELENISINSGRLPQPASGDSNNNHNTNKQAKMIKALIEIIYGNGSSGNIYSLMKEGSKNTQPGELAKDFAERNIRIPAGHKTVQGWVDSVDLEPLEISKDVI